jgi:hypothetical protein
MSNWSVKWYGNDLKKKLEDEKKTVENRRSKKVTRHESYEKNRALCNKARDARRKQKRAERAARNQVEE